MLGNLLVRWCGRLMIINPSCTVKRHNSIPILGPGGRRFKSCLPDHL
ncbi:hypothetical protein [Candidatus Phytoplasma oryzae]|nr:hypothetical protein [Candidatus Phytoplasma oryzae]